VHIERDGVLTMLLLAAVAVSLSCLLAGAGRLLWR
jgi:hypothetical protein